MSDVTRSWFAGVDWGSEKHQVCMRDVAGTVVGERAFAHNGAGLVAMCDWLVSVAGHPSTVAVAIEVPHGPVVDALLDRGFAVHAINPKQLDRLRDRFSVAGAKPNLNTAYYEMPELARESGKIRNAWHYAWVAPGAWAKCRAFALAATAQAA